MFLLASISKNKGNGKFKLMVTENELNTITIAMALLSVVDMEDEAKEQGLDFSAVHYDHLELFNTLTKVTKLYAPYQEEVEPNEAL